MDCPNGASKLDYSTITNNSLVELSNCDISLLSDISSRCYSNNLNTSHNAIKETLNLALTFERLAIFKKVLKDSEPFVSSAREYSQLVDSLATDIAECKEILDISLNRSNSAAETISKTLEFAEKMALTQLISSEIIDKFHVLESYDSNDILTSFEDKIQKLNLKGINCIESILMAQNMLSENKKYKALLELIETKNLELNSICEHIFTQLQDLIKEYSSGSQKAEAFFETIYLKDPNLLFNKSLFILSHRKIYFNYIIEHLIRAKIKRLAQILSMTRFDSINHFLAFAHEIREEDKGFVNILTYLKQSQKPLITEYRQQTEITSRISDTIEDTQPNNNIQDNPLARVLEEKLFAFSSSHHLKTLRLLTFYIDKYKDETGVSFFLEIFEKFKSDLMKEFQLQIDLMNDEFVRETLAELDSGPGIIACDAINNLVNKFKDKYSSN